MATPRGPPASTASRLMYWCLFLLQLQKSRGFLIPAPHSLPSFGAADVAIRPATASAEAELVCGIPTTPRLSGDDSAVSDPGPSLGLSAFQEFAERRKSGAHRVVLDLRPRVEFRLRHLKDSTSIPIDELPLRLLELPPPFAQPVSIVGNEEVRICAEELRTVRRVVLCFWGNVPFTRLNSCADN